MKHKHRILPHKRKSHDLMAPVEADRQPFELLHLRMDELFDDFFDAFDHPRGLLAHRPLDGAGFSPSFAMEQNEKEIVVKAELPGMKAGDVEVLLDENVLTIRGEKREEKKQDKKNGGFSEVRYGSFERVIPLPRSIDGNQAKAKFKRGVLTLKIPKTEEVETPTRRIDVLSE